MKRLDVSDFLREVLAELDDVPDGLAARLMVLVDSTPSSRWSKVRDAIQEAARD